MQVLPVALKLLAPTPCNEKPPNAKTLKQNMINNKSPKSQTLTHGLLDSGGSEDPKCADMEASGFGPLGSGSNIALLIGSTMLGDLANRQHLNTQCRELRPTWQT